jgi:hypothetical protein
MSYKVEDISQVIGQPVDPYDTTYKGNPNERRDMYLYQWLKPELMYILDGLDTMSDTLVRTIHYAFLKDPALLASAAALRLAPAGGTLESVRDWCKVILKPDAPDAQRPHVIIQGGEAVNLYSLDKFAGVPTHDTDARILIPGMTYLTHIAPTDTEALLWFHQYRFLVGLALTTWIDVIGTKSRTEVTKFITDNRLIDNVRGRQVQIYAVFGEGGRGDILPKIKANQYTLDDKTLDYVFQLKILWDFTDSAGTVQERGTGSVAVLDLKAPSNDFRHVGHSAGLHSVFSSEFVRTSFPDITELYPTPGMVPYIRYPIQVTPKPIGSPTDIRIKLVPLGYILWDTIRMLLVNYQFGLERGPKYMKYKQKLWILLASLTDPELSKTAEEIAAQTQGQRGGERDAPQTEPAIDTKKALALAAEFASGRAPPAPGADPTEVAGYLHALSLMNPDFSDYRLPMHIPATGSSRRRTYRKKRVAKL